MHAVHNDSSFAPLEAERSTERLTILIVEDEPLIRMALEEFLEGRGHICAHATTVERALELTQRITFDAALLDVSLKYEQVYPVVRALQQKGVRCIFMTGHAKEDLPAEFAHLRYLEKPFDEAAVIAALDGCGGPELRAVG